MKSLYYVRVTITGQIEIVPEKEKESTTRPKNKYAIEDTTEWLLHMDVGESEYGENEVKRVKDLLQEYKDVFSQNEYDIGRSNLVPHTIKIVGEKPRRSGVRPLNPTLREEEEKQSKILQENDMIKPSKIEFACPVVMVRKKDRSYRFCCDFRNLNSVTRRNVYPLPRIDEILSTLTGAKVFSSVDMKSDYFKCSMTPEDAHKTAFAMQFDLFQWKVMAMGLCNALSSD